MGLFFSNRKSVKKSRVISQKFLEKAGCSACPKKRGTSIAAHGAKKPVIYILGEAPTQGDAERDRFFSGEAGELLTKALHRSFNGSVRYNCITRTSASFTFDKKTAIACCRKSVIDDIVAAEPDIIIGLGHAVLPWAQPEQYNLDAWSGKAAVVMVGSHKCLFMPTYDPVFLLANRKQPSWSRKPLPSVFEERFIMDLKKVPEILRDSRDRVCITSGYTDNIKIFPGESASEVKEIRTILKSYKGHVGLDIETTSLSPYTFNGKHQHILSIAVSTGDDTIAFPVDHPRTDATYRAGIRRMLNRALKQLGTKVAHNLPFELKWLASHVTEDILEYSWDDTMLYSYLDDAKKGTQSLDFNTRQHLGFSLKSLSKVDTKNCLAAKIEDLLLYNALDAKYTKILHDVVSPGLLPSCKWMHKQRIDMATAVTKISLRGLPVSRKWYIDHIEEYKGSTRDLLARIHEIDAVKLYIKRYKTFNPQSEKEFTKIYKECYDIELSSVDAASLEEIGDDLCNLTLEHRKAVKILSTYLEGWLKYVDDSDLIHSDYNTMLTATSRLSSECPNAQNAPKRKNKWCRNGVQAPEGYVLASIDYGQIEARTIGILSKDPAYIDAMWNDSDIHMDWAIKTAYAFPDVVGGRKNLSDAKRMKEWRGTIKNAWTFPLFFGAGVATIARETKIPRDVLLPIIKEFWHVFAASKEWQDEMHSRYKRNGYVETAMGFRRYGPLSHSEVLNTPIQGTASTLVNHGINVLIQDGFPVIGTIHDSLEFCVKVDEAEKVLTEAAEVMLCAPLREFDFICAPLVAEVEIGPSWGELKPWKDFSSRDFGHVRNKRFR